MRTIEPLSRAPPAAHCVPGLDLEVELLEERGREAVRKIHGAEVASPARPASRLAASWRAMSMSRSTMARTPGRWTLTATCWPVTSRPVHLRDGCGGHRVQVELGEDLLTTKHQFGGEEAGGTFVKLGQLLATKSICCPLRLRPKSPGCRMRSPSRRPSPSRISAVPRPLGLVHGHAADPPSLAS